VSVIVGKLRIGEVHALLRRDYPDIELSKIRYYEDKGLVRPTRSRKGYRLYAERDVECLREAIRLAQEEFVPLRVVRLRLIEQGLLDDAPAGVIRPAAREAATHAVSVAVPVPEAPRASLTVVPPSGDAPGEAPEHFGTGDFLAATGLDAADANQLVALGLLSPQVRSDGAVFSSHDVRVGLAARALLARGLEPRLLGSLRRVVEREVGVLDDLTLRFRTPGSRLSPEEARQATSEVAREVSVLRSVLHERALRDYLRG
jgi:DNA-binding transcriptional MerR regulator